jgi:CMP-N,N'-diacetyllegionaminic acid synthase
MAKVYAFVPARSGSQGLKDKNILDIDGHPLLAYAVAFGRALGIDRVILSTDSPAYAEIGRAYGADCPYLRGAAASTGTAMEEDILADMAANLPAYGIDMPDIWIRLKPTNPFRRTASVKAAIARMTGAEPPDSVRIVSPAESRICTVGPEGYLEPLLPHWDPARSVMRRTEFPQAYSPFNLDLLFHRNWLRWGSGYMGRRILPIVEHPITGLDINDRDDFDLVKALIEARPRPRLVETYIVPPAQVGAGA